MSQPAIRLIDRVIKHKKYDDSAKRWLRDAQKFFVDGPSLYVLGRENDDGSRVIGCDIATLKMPYQNVWLEIEHQRTTIAFHIQTDASLQVGTIVHYDVHFDDDGNELPEVQDYPGYHYPFLTNLDMTQDTEILRFGRAILPDATKLSEKGQQRIRKAWQDTIDVLSSLPAIVFFLHALNRPKTVIEREDLSAYNKRQRQMFRHKHQRQEFHTVKISLDDQCIWTGAAGEDRAYTPRGEHGVRGFFRHYQSGRTTWVSPHRRGNGPLKSQRIGYELRLNASINFHVQGGMTWHGKSR